MTENILSISDYWFLLQLLFKLIISFNIKFKLICIYWKIIRSRKSLYKLQSFSFDICCISSISSLQEQNSIRMWYIWDCKHIHIYIVGWLCWPILEKIDNCYLLKINDYKNIGVSHEQYYYGFNWILSNIV